MLNWIKIHKVISAVIGANLLAVIIIIVAFVIHNAKTATVDIAVVPMDATVKLNGQVYDNNMTHNLLPGKYTAEITMEGMESKTVDLDLTEDDYYRLHTYLLDVDGTFKYYETHPAQVEALSQLGLNDQAVNEFVDKYNNIYSIVNDLPLQLYNRTDDAATTWGVYIEQTGTSDSDDLANTPEDLAADCPVIVCLTAYVNNTSKDVAYDLIRKAGYNPDDYQITFGK